MHSIERILKIAKRNKTFDTCMIRHFNRLSQQQTWNHHGETYSEEFMKLINEAYAQVVHWRPNLCKIPSGACGKQFVVELTHLFNAFAVESNLEAIALKAAMTLPSLMLQKPYAKSKTCDHISCLQRRLRFWEKGGEIWFNFTLKNFASQRQPSKIPERSTKLSTYTRICVNVLTGEGIVLNTGIYETVLEMTETR